MLSTRDFILGKCMNFAVRVTKLRRYLIEEKHEYDISKQLLRSGTSIGANMAESQNAASSKDFIAKATIALKEGRESLYWIELLYKTDYISSEQYHSLSADCVELLKLLTSIIKTTKSNLSISTTEAQD